MINNQYDEKRTEQLKNLLNSNKFDTINAIGLVRLGADPDTKSSNGKPLLHVIGMSTYVETLIKTYKANVNIQDDSGYTLLQNLLNGQNNSYSNPFNSGAVMRLIRLGAQPNTKDSDGKPLLHLMIDEIMSVYRYNKNESDLKALINDYKADIHMEDAYIPVAFHI